MKIKLLFVFFLFTVVGWGQVLLANATPVVQNFDGMGTANSATLPANWKMSVPGATSPTWAASGNFTNSSVQASSGSPTTGGRYNWGNTATTDRAIGFMTSVTFASPNSIMAYYRNTNASNLTQLTVSYKVERYRINSGAASVQFYYSLDGSVWASVAAGDVAATLLPTGISAHDFAPGLTVNVASFTIGGLDIATNEDVYLRWNLNTTGANSQGIGIDDVNVAASFLAACSPPVNPSGTIAGTTPACGSTTLSYSAPGASLYWQTSATGTNLTQPVTSNLIATTSGTYYVRAHDGSCWSTGTVSRVVVLHSAPSITVQPVNSSIIDTGNTSFSVTASNAVGYQWQVSTDGGVVFNAVSNGGVYSGANSVTLTLTGASLSMNGYRYQCLVSGNAPCPSVTSAQRTLTVSLGLPKINVRSGTGSFPTIANGTTTTSALNNTQFATTAIGSSQTKNFRIENTGTGTAVLNVSSITFTGGNSGDFSVSGIALPATINTGSSLDFSVTFSPAAVGMRTTEITIANNDATLNPYHFALQGTGSCTDATNVLTPTSGPEGTQVLVTATANTLNGATATLNGIPALVTPISATQIQITVPSGATTGNLITTNAQGCSATNFFTIINKGIAGCEGGSGAPSDLFISEVTDATAGGLSYIEIYNGTGSTINLVPYSIKIAGNGGSTYAGSVSLANFNLVSGSTYLLAIGVVASPTASNTCIDVIGGNGELADQTSGNAGVNFADSGTGNENIGHDHIGLFKNTTLIDSWGTYESGTWAVGLNLGDRGANFRRKSTATVPSIVYNNADWDIVDWAGSGSSSCVANNYSNLGIYDFSTGTPPILLQHPAFTDTCGSTLLSVTGAEGFLGGNALAYQWFMTVPGASVWEALTNTGVYSGVSTASLSISSTTGLNGYQYYCQVRENTASCYRASNAVSVTESLGTITWNGTDWIGGMPSLSKDVIINGVYTTANGSFEARSLVNNGTIIILGNTYIQLEYALTNNGTFTIEDNGSLVQVCDNAVNTGNITLKRRTQPVKRYDYTYWSSPVAPQQLKLMSPQTLIDKYYSYNAASQAWLQHYNGAVAMVKGKGYIVRAPQSFDLNSASIYEAPFNGVPNNGVIQVVIVGGTDKWNLIGNPYPSAIDADAFLAHPSNTSVIDGTLYLWTHNSPPSNLIPGDATYNYTASDYAAYNFSGGVATSSSASSTGLNSLTPNGKIASGQAFFVKGLNSSNVTFNNSMRETGGNNQFFRSASVHVFANTTTILIEKSRIWLNLSNAQGAFGQLLVGYIEGATNGLDRGFDGGILGGNYVTFYSVTPTQNLTIQGRALPFDTNDSVQLGYISTLSGAFKIGIDHLDGLFLTNQTVYLEDLLLNTIHNLTQSPYDFTTAVGTFNNRFVLRYTNAALGSPGWESTADQVVVVSSNQQLHIRSELEPLQKVTVCDLLGRVVYTKNTINATEFNSEAISVAQQPLLVKVVLENGQIVVRKIMF